MRINRYLAAASGLSRRRADQLISEGRVKVDSSLATTGQDVKTNQVVKLDDKVLELPKASMTIILNKPVGYVVSRKGQGASTIYSLLPSIYKSLKPVGRLDKDSSGLLLLSSDGIFIQSLSHPSFNKLKVYEVELNKPLTGSDRLKISKGIKLDDGLSHLTIQSCFGNHISLSMQEGRNRQIRRTFEALGYRVTKLNRSSFGDYHLDNLKPGDFREI